jgi:hypothetical protein
MVSNSSAVVLGMSRFVQCGKIRPISLLPGQCSSPAQSFSASE